MFSHLIETIPWQLQWKVDSSLRDTRDMSWLWLVTCDVDLLIWDETNAMDRGDHWLSPVTVWWVQPPTFTKLATLHCAASVLPSSQFPLIIIMSRLTLPVAGSSCSLECLTWISLTPASREQNWNDYIKTSTFPINQPTVLTAHSPASHGSSPPARVRCPPGSGCWSRCPGPSSWSMQNIF